MKRNKHKGQSSRRKRFTREDPLLLSPPTVRGFSLECHMALAVRRSGHGSLETVTCLRGVTYLAYVIGRLAIDEAGLHMIRNAEGVLDNCAKRTVDGNGWYRDDDETEAIKHVLAMHDDQHSSLPKHHYADAWATVQRHVSQGRSPIEASLNHESATG